MRYKQAMKKDLPKVTVLMLAGLVLAGCSQTEPAGSLAEAAPQAAFPCQAISASPISQGGFIYGVGSTVCGQSALNPQSQVKLVVTLQRQEADGSWAKVGNSQTVGPLPLKPSGIFEAAAEFGCLGSDLNTYRTATVHTYLGPTGSGIFEITSSQSEAAELGCG